MSLMAAADVVLSMGGYNTVCELLTLHKRAVVVPRIRPGQEQALRAERMAARGLLRMLHPEQLAPDMLWAMLRAELAAHARHAPLPRMNALDGLARVTAAIFAAIDVAGHEPTPIVSATASPGRHVRAPQDPPRRDASWHPHPLTAAARSAC